MRDEEAKSVRCLSNLMLVIRYINPQFSRVFQARLPEEFQVEGQKFLETALASNQNIWRGVANKNSCSVLQWMMRSSRV